MTDKFIFFAAGIALLLGGMFLSKEKKPKSEKKERVEKVEKEEDIEIVEKGKEEADEPIKKDILIEEEKEKEKE